MVILFFFSFRKVCMYFLLSRGKGMKRIVSLVSARTVLMS